VYDMVRSTPDMFFALKQPHRAATVGVGVGVGVEFTDYGVPVGVGV